MPIEAVFGRRPSLKKVGKANLMTCKHHENMLEMYNLIKKMCKKCIESLQKMYRKHYNSVIEIYDIDL